LHSVFQLKIRGLLHHNLLSIKKSGTIVNFQFNKSTEDEINIPSTIVASIIDKINFFEQRKMFLKSQITLASMAKNLKTNSTYLSKVINNIKQKNFTNYINDLRISYAIEQLQTNQMFRRYSILAIAQEVGFNNYKSFSRAFVKKTGKHVSLFIKELD